MPFIIPGKLTIGDEVRVTTPLDSYGNMKCQHCDDEVGWDEYEMDEIVGQIIKVQEFPRYRYTPICGAETFVCDGWLWTTCWIDRWWSSTTNGREPDWEV